MNTGKSRDVLIFGIVVPENWDEKGHVTGTAIHTYDEKEYIVEPAQVNMTLRAYLHKKIEISGKIKERLDGRTANNVRNYRVARKKNSTGGLFI